MSRTTTRLVLTLVMLGTPALADDDCAVPMSTWQPREAVVKLAAEQGWDLRRIRIDEGCYVLIGHDADGQAIEVTLNPATLEVVAFEFEVDHAEGGAENLDQDE